MAELLGLSCDDFSGCTAKYSYDSRDSVDCEWATGRLAKEMQLAFAMGTHGRLGQQCLYSMMPEEVVELLMLLVYDMSLRKKAREKAENLLGLGECGRFFKTFAPLPLSPEVLAFEERALAHFMEKERQKANEVFACEIEEQKKLLSDACVASATPDVAKIWKRQIMARIKKNRRLICVHEKYFFNVH